MTVRLAVFSLESLDAEEQSGAAIAALLGVAPPTDWPPPFNDAAVRQFFRARLTADPLVAPWLGHYIMAVVEGRETLVGMGGFKGPPDDGMVEIGYSLVPDYHSMGIGTAAVDELLAKAFADKRVSQVKAETPQDFVASRALLETCGFRLTGHRTDPDEGELVVYQIDRSEAA